MALLVKLPTQIAPVAVPQGCSLASTKLRPERSFGYGDVAKFQPHFKNGIALATKNDPKVYIYIYFVGIGPNYSGLKTILDCQGRRLVERP